MTFFWKDIFTYFVTRKMSPPEGKSMEIDTVSQNRLNAIMNFDSNSKKRF